ncbi:MAG: 23S rRNA (pseudouridine(1915)-N(3))-methyltransferase RlmH [Candidatus Saccharibacteria bacterium]|nr:23S rRNA (pseudouridine(1915)-N(3))-methyltransferase RlmH [Candidatus Saccharibacteria bacterium]
MIKVIAGGKKTPWVVEIVEEYQKRMKKPYKIEWQFLAEEKLLKKLENWEFDKNKEYVVICDERGEILSSPDFSRKITGVVENGRDVIILIGGAFGFPSEIRGKADFLWSFSKLVFPHRLAQAIVAEQVYRAQEIALGRPYHHE